MERISSIRLVSQRSVEAAFQLPGLPRLSGHPPASRWIFFNSRDDRSIPGHDLRASPEQSRRRESLRAVP